MQQEVFANTEDFGGPDIIAAPCKASRPGQDAPYARRDADAGTAVSPATKATTIRRFLLRPEFVAP